MQRASVPTGPLFASLADFNIIFGLATHFHKLPADIEQMPTFDVIMSQRAIEIQALHNYLSHEAATKQAETKSKKRK